MGFDRPSMKLEARRAIMQAKPSAFVAALLVVILGYIVFLLSERLVGIQIDRNVYLNWMQTGNVEAMYNYVLMHQPDVLQRLCDFVIGLLRNIVGVGFVIYMMNIVRGFPASYWNLLDGFAIVLKYIWLTILIWVFTTLWSLLFVIPGIVASYRYRMALYLMIDNPEMSAMDCIRESKRMMSGRKGELFILDLSFIGWYILCAIPFVSVWVMPYTEATYVLFYEGLRAQYGYADNGYTESGPAGYREPWQE